MASHRAAADTEESSFRLFVEAVKDYGIFLLDPTGHIASWNAGAARIKGYAADEIIGRHFSVFYPKEDIAAGKPEHGLRIAAHDGRVEDEAWRVRKDGSRFWANVVITALRDQDGKLIGFGKVTRDMTERRRAEEAEHEARILAEETSRAKDEFLATLSHELRTPLNVIMGEIWRLRSRALPPEAAERAWDALERNARLQLQLLEDVLDASRVVTGRLHVQPQVVDLCRVVDEAVAVLRPTSEMKGVSLVSEIDPLTGLILGDATRLHQVTWNLLANAVKFTPSGGTVTVSVGREGTDVVIRVTDTGAGIDPAFLHRVFDRFAQADSSATRTEGGLGLGLALVRHLVEAHGGHVYARSNGIGQGATFDVRLPIPAVLPLSSRASTTSLTLHGIRVLLVDADADGLHATSGMLRQFGAEVATAQSVAEVLPLLVGFSPDVLLADIALPDQDGYDLIRLVRSHENARVRHVPAAALTAYSTIDDRRRVLRAGYHLHVPKPIQPLDLALTVTQLRRTTHDGMSLGVSEPRR